MKISSEKIIGLLPIIIFILLAVFWLSSCGTFERMTMSLEGRILAKKYIKNKYDFNAKVVGTSVPTTINFEASCFPRTSGYVIVKMEYNGKTFEVYCKPDKEDSERDNYQYEDILGMLEQNIRDNIDIPTEEIITYLDVNFYKDEMLRDYVDDSNLVEIVSERTGGGRAVISLVNQDVNAIDVEKLSKATGIERFLIVDYEDMDAYLECPDRSFSIDESPGLYVLENQIYINEYREASKNNDDEGWYEQYEKIKKIKVDDMVFIPRLYEETIEVSPAELDPADRWNTEYGLHNLSQVYPAYEIQTESSMVFMYIPRHYFLPDAGGDNLVIVGQKKNEDGTTSYNKYDTRVVGGYLYAIHHGETVTISVLRGEE